MRKTVRGLVDAEPVTEGKVLTEEDVNQAYNWYRNKHTKKEAKAFAMEYLATILSDEAMEHLEQLSPANYITIGWISRMSTVGAIVPEKTKEWFFKEINKLMEKEIDSEDELPVVSAAALNQAKERAKYEGVISNIEAELDGFIEGGFVSAFKTYDYLRAKEVKAFQARRIGEYYNRLLVELNEVQAGEDEQLKEAYSFMSKAQLKRYSEFVEGIVIDCDQMAQVAKVARKPRKTKTKSAGQLVAKIKYKTSDDNYKIHSVDPSNIVGALQLWVFNTETRKLGVYHAKDQTGLTMKGTTVQGYDEDKSVQKKLRKPEKVLPVVTSGGKVALRSLLDEVVAVASPLSGRINSDTVLVRTLR